MAEVDTSSYKQPALPSFLDIASKYGGLQQQQQQIQSNALGIDKQKLDLVNQRFSTIAKQYTGLINKADLTQDDITQQIDNDLKLGLIPPDMAATEKAQIPATAGMPGPQAAKVLSAHLSNKLTQAMTTMEAINYHLGARSADVGNNQQTQATTFSPKPGEGLRPLGPPIQQLPAPTTAIPTDQGDRQLGPYSYPGTSLSPLPVGPNPTRGNIQGVGNVTGVDVGPDQPNLGAPNQPRLPAGSPTGPLMTRSPLFEAGKAQYVQDQQISAAKSQAMIPALQALPLMKDIMSGPGTAGFTHAIAGLKAFGILSTDTNDPIVARQEIAKKLNAYILSNPVGQRSDAQQTLAEASSPSPNVQLLPALIKLTQDAIAQDRTIISKPGAFNDSDFSKYGAHTTNYATGIDQQAMRLDNMDAGERQALLNKYSKEVNGKRMPLSTPQAQKFWKTLAIIKQQGLF